MGSGRTILLLLGVLCLPSLVTTRVFFRRQSSYATLMKQLSLINYEKAKVETLGDIFKRHVQQLRHARNKQVELIFLIDSSGTVGRDYFYEEINFVKDLLADFTVDVNSTRVSVITFSSPHKIFRHIDYLTHPGSDNHKCRLLNEDIGQVDYTPGGTHTLGAFLEAEKVLKSARPDAAKAIFLMTDGYSNGGDPRPVANKLKKQGVKIFTFGIRDGFVRELEDMASDPKNETCYIVDSFEEFKALAKRALHTDLQSGTYVEQNLSKCKATCTKAGMEPLCCHANATCSCGTYTGQYDCLCKPGFYGTGRGKSGCKHCPPGTYKNFTGLGDSNICASCPDEHQTTPPGAVSINQCVCKRGYQSFGNKECTVFRCPELSPPENGYFVNNACNNVFNAACGLRCNPGYELRGGSLRICQDDGTWSGQDTECIMKTCPSLPPPKNGHMSCTSADFSYRTECKFVCNAGYTLFGSRIRHCMALAHWTGIAARCREVTCPPLVEIRDGRVTPPSCTTREVVFGSTCQMSCSSGYVLKGPHTKQCTPDGTWMSTENGTGTNQCIDETPPVLDCPSNMVVSADELQETTQVFWTAPVPVDNSGFRPVLTSEPAVTPGFRFPIGTTYITYKAEDLNHNIVRCRFYIRVVDRTSPRVDKCVSPAPVVSKNEWTSVVLQPPQFSDNSGRPVEMVSSVGAGDLFPYGTFHVVYTAYDGSNNNNTCTINVVIVPHLCSAPEPPKHGNITCEDSGSGILCHISCQDGFGFALPASDEYFCDFEEGRWLPKDVYPFPDCAVVQISNDIIQPASLTLTGDILCQDQSLIQRIQQEVALQMEDKIASVCENDLHCSIGSLSAVCEDEDNEGFNKIQTLASKKRKKRNIDYQTEKVKSSKEATTRKSKLTFEFLLEGSVKSTNQTEDKKLHQLSESLVQMLTTLQQQAGQGQMDLKVGDETLKYSGMFYDMESQSYRCPDGSVLINDTCVSCPVGNFWSDLSKSCDACPKGTYQPQEGQVSCLKCPLNTSTVRPNARREDECLGMCSPGTFSPTGLGPCETCHIGYYQPNSSAINCHPCGHGRLTLRRGAELADKCLDLCQPGYISESGLVPCLPCPRGSYQPKSGQTECLQCFIGGSTKYTGTSSRDECIISDDGSEMQADASVKKGGSRQEFLPFNPCFGEPCQNGGTCEFTKGKLFTCVCAKGFTGNECETVLDLCDARPCHNGGICQPTPGGFRCDCLKGFTGSNCEINIDECASSPCANKGTCVDGINSFTCNCPVGYTGRTCSSSINDCADVPCLNGGTCLNTQSSFTCLCVRGYAGETCEIDEDECLFTPCENDGICKDLPGAYSCQCKPGYTGASCESEIDECRDDPCQNGARCEDLVDDYMCHCPEGYSGKKCEKALTSQYQLDFANPTIMDYAQLTIDNPMTSVTVAFWMRSSDKNNQGTPFSYSVYGEPNAFTVTDYNNLNIIINGEPVSVGVSLTDGSWHHIALTWSSVRGDWKIYVDGILRDQAYNLSTLKPIPGKGIFIVGQEQDTFGGGFSSMESFQGSLTLLNVWDQEKTLVDVDKMRLSCESFNGNIISWPSVQASVKGSVGSSASSFCLTCPTPVKPLSGSVAFTDTSPGSVANYACDTGYNLLGSPAPKCLITGNWDDSAPDCMAITCGSPGSFRNGVIIGRDFTFNKTIRFQCNAGYELEGVGIMTCDIFGDWDGTKPKCVEIQCTLPLLSENTVPSSNKKKFSSGAVVTFSCQPGNLLQTNHDSVTCQRDGSWDRSVPSCDPQKCSTPPSIDNGEPWTSNPEYNVGEIVRYQCDFGYEFNPDAARVRRSIACLPTGDWEEELPECSPIQCPDPPYVANAISTESSKRFQSVVEFTCLPGFEPSGSNTITCEEKKDWSTLTFKCAPVDCGNPPAFGNGVITGDVYRYRNLITYQCSSGYMLVGDAERQCEESGKWSGSDPACQPISCGPVPEIANGQAVYQDTTFQSTAQYNCDLGFIINGFPDIICDSSGLWEPEAPTCEPQPCPQPSDIDFGTYTASGLFVFNTTLEYTCNIGYQLQGEGRLICQTDGTWSLPAPRCQQTECPPLASPKHGSVVAAGNTFSSQASYNCDPGFRLVGVSARTCQADGSWSAEPPVCQSTNCLEPEKVENGRHDYKDLSIGSIVRYYCNKGYLLEGDQIRRCQDNLTFTGDQPFCKPVSCGNPGDVNNGQLRTTQRGFFFEAVATYSCNKGYALKGPVNRTCGADGKWSGQKPECVVAECSKFSTVVSNGRTNSTDSFVGAAIRYTCDPGYKLVGSAVRKCLSDGSWDVPIPACESVECPGLKLLNGVLSGFQRTLGTVIRFSCRKNFRLVGPAERTCLESGRWSGDEPQCVKIKCDDPEEVANSETTIVNDTAINYNCRLGYALIGSSVRVCDGDDNWLPEAPVCELVTCPDLSVASFPNGKVNYSSNYYQDVVTYECDSGYRLSGEATRTCLSGAQWDGIEPECELIVCAHPGNLKNGKIVRDLFTVNSSVQFECDKGYKLIEADKYLCRSDGTWEGTFPSCDQILCPLLAPEIPHGKITVSGINISSQAEYQCDLGFNLVGGSSRECLETGQWSGGEPFCADGSCIPPPPIEHAIMEGTSFDIGDNITYTCEDGFYLEGDFIRICQLDGSWSNLPPSCSPIYCPEPPYMETGRFNGDSSTYKGVLTIECFEGYEPVGSLERVCQANGTWSGTDGDCLRISCGPPADIANAVIAQVTDYLFESRVVYSCIEGYSPSGLDTTDCLSDRSWSSIDFACTIVSCPIFTPDDFTHGILNVSGFTYGSHASFSCQEGYRLNGSPHITCTAQAVWTAALPVCNIVQCSQLLPLLNGRVISSSNTYRSLTTFVCDVGYRLVGVETIECLSSGRWNDSQPVCQLVSCGLLPFFIANGQISSPKLQYFYQDTASFSCDSGYELSGQNTLTCLESGYFDQPPPSCERIPCPPPNPIGNGVFTLSENETVVYECLEGYELDGQSSLQCLLGGTWSGLAPVCLPVVCPEPEDIDNGWIEATEMTFSHTIIYHCDPGYYLEPSIIRVCQANQTWSNEKPACLPISCGRPVEDFENGDITGQFLYGSSVEYVCWPGFALSGDKFRQCREDGAWTGSVPICQRLSCPTPVSIEHGTISGVSYLFGDSVNYTCEQGFDLQGDGVRICESSLIWSGQDPICKRISCGNPEIPDHGFILGESYLYGDQIKVACNAGYRLNGSEEKWCQVSGQWSGVATFCLQIYCPQPPEHAGMTDNRTLGSELYTISSVVSYKCGIGHTLVGTGLTVCQIDGSWSSNPMNCTPVSCPVVSNVNNGTVTGQKFDYLSVLDVTCYAGFELIGNSTLECTETGSWSAAIPYCLVISCPSFVVEHGHFYIEPADLSTFEADRSGFLYIYGDTVTFLCDVGYELSGPRKSQCQIDGNWSDTGVLCSLVKCPVPIGIQHAVFAQSSLTYKSTLEVSCLAGYDLIGDSELTCGATGSWEEALPQCVLLVCGSPPAVANAVVLGDSFRQGENITYKCKLGYELLGNNILSCGEANAWVGSPPSCVEVDCGDPPVLEHSVVTATTTTYRSRAVVVCQAGYNLQGNDTILCAADRVWKYDTSLACAPVDCGQPPAVANSVYSVTTTTLDSLAEYSCDKGHFLLGVSSLVCDQGGSWVEELPVCSPVSCLEPPTVEHANYTSEETVYLSVVNYTCVEGYIFGEPDLTSLVCGDMGFWEGRVPTCQIVNCGPPPQVLNAYYLIDNNRTDYLSNAIYHCDTGYTTNQLDASYYYTCVASGIWVGANFTCQKVQCSDLPEIPNMADVIINETTYGSLAYFSCSPGHVLSGSNYVACTETGQWSDNQYACLSLECQEPENPEFGSVEYNTTSYLSTLAFSCQPGYQLVGNESSVCLDTAIWSSKIPICSPVDCHVPPTIHHGRVLYTATTFKNLAHFSCNPGYILSHTNPLICEEEGSWLGDPPNCSAVVCHEPLQPPHSQVVFSTLTYQSVARFSCIRGYRLVGAPLLVCSENGTWSSSSPECLPLDCSQPPVVSSGQVNVSGTTFGSWVWYTCDKGHQLAGSSMAFCGADGLWNSSAPRCDVVDCREAPEVANGDVIVTASTYLSVANYQCNVGYKLLGIGEIRCDEFGTWDGGEGSSCDIITCAPPPNIVHGSVFYNDLNYSSSARYVCNEDYRLKGLTEVFCGNQGFWDGKPPVCIQLTCPALDNIANGFVKITGFHIGAEASFTCSTGFYIEGDNKLICLKNQSWSSGEPVCKRVSCAPPPVIAHALIIGDTGRNVSSMVTYTCVKGYQLVNDVDNKITITCGHDGDWAGKIPSCEIVVCSDLPPEIPNSTHVTTGDTYRSEALYACNHGYTLTGSPILVCNHDGLWLTDDPPSCYPISCGDPPTYSHSTYKGVDFTYGNFVNYTCNPGYDLVGTFSSVCRLDGSWSPVAFTCQIRHCQPLIEVPRNGEILRSSSVGPYIVGSVVEFACQPDFTLVGSRSIRCSESGQWDSGSPQCVFVIDLCSEVLKLDNIVPPPPGKVTGDVINVTCQEGYIGKGNLTSVCRSDGSWSHPEGHCEKVFCGRPQVDNIQTTAVKGRSYFYGDSAKFLCRYGYIPVPSQSSVTCLASGQWDAQLRCIPHCKQSCQNGGVCIGANRCKCMPGWVGNLCQTAMCVLPCLHGGHCVAPYKCECPQGYSGARCHEVLCDRPCENGGRCLTPNKCQCPSRFQGAFCDRKAWLNNTT